MATLPDIRRNALRSLSAPGATAIVGSRVMAAMVLHVLHADAPEYANAHSLVRTLLNELRSIDLDHPDTQKAIEEIKVIFKSTGRPTG
jgi:hypothetical protein